MKTLASDQLAISNRIALVYMPWGAITRPSAALGLLAACLRQSGHAVDCHYLNIPFSRMIGPELYHKISDMPGPFVPEWFFSSALFGRQGLGWLHNSIEDLDKTALGKGLLNDFGFYGLSLEKCRQIAEVEVPRFLEQCLNDVSWNNYSIVGFSTMFAQNMACLYLSERLKRLYPHLKIVFGGANVDGEMGGELIRTCGWIDYVVHGEGEVSFLQLIDVIAHSKPHLELEGVSYRNGQEIVYGYKTHRPVFDLNASPFPMYDEYFDELKRNGLDREIRITLPFESSRGCWWGAKHHCTFCGLNGGTMTYRKKMAQRALSEVRHLADTYGSLQFAATDNILAMDYIKDFLPALAGSDIDFSIFYEVKANLKPTAVALLRDAGIRRIQPGIESFSSRLLREMRKGTTGIQNVQLLRMCAENDLLATWNILYGFPNETPEDYAAFPEIFRLLCHLPPPSGVCRVQFERFSPLQFDAEKFGLKLKAHPWYSLILPEQLVNLEKLAYYFEDDGYAVKDFSYLNDTNKAWKRWRELWDSRQIFCYFEKGPNFVTIYDNRPRPIDGPVITRKIVLKGLQASIFLQCIEHRSYKAILEGLNLADQPGAPSTVQNILSALVKQGLVFQEGDRYVALPLRKRNVLLSSVVKRADTSRAPVKDSQALPLVVGIS